MIFRIFRRDFLHGIAIGQQTRLLRRALKVAIQLAHGRDIGAFALRLRADFFTPCGALAAELQLTLVLHSRCERIAPITERDSPVCDSAARVFRQHRIESFYGTAELEGMQQRNRAVEFLLHGWSTRCGKAYRTQLLPSPMLMLMLLRHAARSRGDQ